MDRPDDARVANLALAARGGDRAAADELTELMSRAMRSLARKIAAQSRGRVDFDEGLAIVGHALARSIACFREDAKAKFSTFAITVMNNAATSAVRDSDPTKTRLGYSRPSREHEFDPDSLASPCDAAAMVERSDMAQRLTDSAGRLLEPRHRRILELRAQGKGRGDIMKELGIGATTVWRLEREARNRARIGIFASGDPELVAVAVGGAL
jgi:RNA polymerase sigma factor (sigma-70 family)